MSVASLSAVVEGNNCPGGKTGRDEAKQDRTDKTHANNGSTAVEPLFCLRGIDDDGAEQIDWSRVWDWIVTGLGRADNSLAGCDVRWNGTLAALQ